MAKLEQTITGDFDTLIKIIEDGIVAGNTSASLEDHSDFVEGNTRCSVRVFERYSAVGGNRVSMNVTLFQDGDKPVHLSAITSGGSQAIWYKINTLGENAFLKCIVQLMQEYESAQKDK